MWQITVGGLVARTFHTWWRHAWRFYLLALVLYVPMVVVFGGFGALAGAGRFDELEGWGVPLAVGAGLVGLLMLVWGVVYTAAVSAGTVHYLAGRPLALGAMVRRGFQRYWPVLGASLLFGLAMAGGFLLLVVPGVILGTALGLAVPAAVSEEVGPLAALRRSWALTADHRLVLFAAFVVAYLAVFGASLVGQVVVTVAVMALGPTGAFVGMGINMLVQGFVSTLMTVLPAVAYHDLRLLKEGADTGQLARVFE